MCEALKTLMKPIVDAEIANAVAIAIAEKDAEKDTEIANAVAIAIAEKDAEIARLKMQLENK